jgi:UDP-N-acetylmuramate dehydrogenase
VTAVSQARNHGVTPFILGGGANILVADAGIRGLVIAYRGERHAFQEADGEVILRTEAGAQIKELARESVARGLEGLEWAVDIPGTVGGAVIGNAGAFGGYIGDCLRSVKALDCDGKVREIDREDVAFCYRSSKFKQQACEERTIILAATLVLRHGDSSEVSQRAASYSQRRWERQPREPSCGSVFKRTANYPAGFLIEQCGLKGQRRGDAAISPQHANFIVNLGNAKATDVRFLIELAQERVRAMFGEELELEVELVGRW